MVKGPIEVFRPAPSGAPRSWGRAARALPQIMSQMITPSTRFLRLIISALNQCEFRPDITSARSGPRIVQRLWVMEFVYRPDVRTCSVFTVQTSLQVDDGEAAAVELDVIVVAGLWSRPVPTLYEAAVLNLVENVLHSSRLPRMVAGIFAANFSMASEYRRIRRNSPHQVHEFQALWRLEFSKPLQAARSRREAAGLAAGDDTHAAIRGASLRPSRGSAVRPSGAPHGPRDTVPRRVIGLVAPSSLEEYAPAVEAPRAEGGLL